MRAIVEVHHAGLSEPRRPGGLCPPPQYFGRSVNPISTRGLGADYASHITNLSRIFRPSYGPVMGLLKNSYLSKVSFSRFVFELLDTLKRSQVSGAIGASGSPKLNLEFLYCASCKQMQ